jgi:hypothetical protein
VESPRESIYRERESVCLCALMRTIQFSMEFQSILIKDGWIWSNRIEKTKAGCSSAKQSPEAGSFFSRADDDGKDLIATIIFRRELSR